MKNNIATLINKKLGVVLYNESALNKLELNRFSKKEINELMIDDLISPDNIATKRLTVILNEIKHDITDMFLFATFDRMQNNK